ncbi:uncharacterized protein LOC113367043 [Ctenocephalides felis]|uniref:uncharacterized protein LOC113367043 n=1 Tax=Ctenocephalides felis TaxID=7515 RepID=UPI000E6E4866|nr:uncharacterized protein LOC113367043 [Ctenocephalides felis]
MDKKTEHEYTYSKLPGPGFIAPDGGWGWMVVLASGVSTLSVLPVIQLFGLIFRERFEHLGMTNSEMTTIINVNIALTSCVGLANGPMFRKFNYRPIAIFGSILVICGLLFVSVANSFITYLLSFSVLYGSGVGICFSANSLALNTYFNKRRRRAVSLSWTVAALGPIVTPYLITMLLPQYGVQGTVLLAAGLSMHALVSALILQPAQRHAKQNVHITEEGLKNEQLSESYYKDNSNGCNTPLASRASKSNFSSQYFSNDFVESTTPMLSRANDGWYSSLSSSRLSLASKKYANDVDSGGTLIPKSSFNNLTENRSKKASMNNLAELRLEKSRDTLTMPDHKLKLQRSYSGTSTTNEEDNVRSSTNPVNNKNNIPEQRSRKSSFSSEHKPKRQKRHSVTIKIEESEVEDCPSNKAPQDLQDNEKLALSIIQNSESEKHQYENKLKPNGYKNKNNFNDGTTLDTKSSCVSKHNKSEEKEVLIEASKRLEIYASDFNSSKKNTSPYEERLIKNEEDDLKVVKVHHTLWQKIKIFFDLDLLKDFTYVNLMIGINIANFAEINFSILTPFILADFGLEKGQIAIVMSLLGGMDILVRFLIPFATERIPWQNKSFFLFGVLGMAFGRLVLIYFHSYPVILCACAWIGLNKALRTVFTYLVIASHVPLQRLPAATGIQLLFAGLMYTIAGPVVGWIRDTTDYPTTLHCLNILTYATAISWIGESWYRKRSASSSCDS